jgi:hypothetical protein
MNTNDTYQGWTNRETWAAHLWLNNSVTIYQGAFEYAKPMTPESLREYTERVAYSRPDMAREIGSLWRVNWAEVAAALTKENDK